jgi:hypothetical protein
MGSALSWALYCSLLRNKDRRIPANAFVAVISRRPYSASGGDFLAVATPDTSFAAYHDIYFTDWRIW